MWGKQMQICLMLVGLLLDPSRYITAMRLDEQYCGFKQTCAGNGTNVDDSCCQLCECTEICKEKGTCCPDKEGLGDNKEVIKQHCLPAIYMQEGLISVFDVQSFYVRTRCPKTFENVYIREKCENEIPESLEDITFVSSETGTIVYKNIYCGLCHDEKRTVPWKLGVSFICVKQFSKLNITLNTVLQTFLTNCVINLIAPDDLVFKHTSCYDRALAISKCNQTGEWEVYDSNLEELCHRHQESETNYKSEQIFGPFKVYLSLECYLCNTKANVVRDVCILDEGRTPVNALSSLIKPNAWTGMEDQKRRSNKCNADQILDTFFNVCRRLYCPTFFLPNRGQCIPFLNMNANYRFFVRLVPQQPVHKTEFVMSELMSRHESVQRQLGLGKCGKCRARILMERDLNETLVSGVYLEFVLSPKGLCTLEHLVSKLNFIEMTSSDITLKLNKTLVAFWAFWDNTPEGRGFQFEEKLRTEGNVGCVAFPSPPASNCAKVKLMTTEYKTVITNHVYANELLFAPIQDENGTVFVCCDKYIINTWSAGNRKQFNVAVGVFILIIASF